MNDGKGWKIWLAWFPLLFAIYLATRLTFLTKLPIFTDEAIYIRWSQIGARDANWRFISLVDGKQPMFTWIMMGLLKIIADPLFAGRFVSVLAGMASVVGLWFLTEELFHKKRISLLACILYIVCPFTLLYDRMALYDSLTAAFAIWNLYIAILFSRYVRLDTALILGMTLAGGMLNKTSGFISLYLLPSTLLLFDWKKHGVIKRLGQWVWFAAIAAVLSQALYSILRLSPLFYMVSQKDHVFVYSIHDWLSHPFTYVYGNLKGLFDWLIHYLTVPLFPLVFVPLIFFWKKIREKLVLYIWWFAPLFGLALFGKILYPRFTLFMTLPLFPLIATVLDQILTWSNRRIFGLTIFCALFFPSIYTGYYIITNPLYAPILYADKGQYIDSWPSGWGVKEVNAFLLGESKKNKVTVYTDGTFGLLPYAIEIYLVDKPNIEIVGIWPLPNAMPQDVADDVKDHPTYLVMNQTLKLPNWNLKLMAEYPKGNRTDRTLRLYQILPPVLPTHL